MSAATPETLGAIDPARAARLAVPALVVWLVLHLPSVCVPHLEIDEHVYRALARSLARGDGYTTRGTSIHATLEPSMYDRPLFHHPPLGPVLLIPFARDPSRGVVVGWLGHLLVILAVLDLARRRLPETLAGERALALGLVLAATDPLLVFAGNKIWLDAPVAGLSALGIALFDRWLATRAPSAWWGSAALCALALWTKLTAFLASGAILALALGALARARDGRERLAIARATVVWGGLVALAIFPWLWTFHETYGVWIPSWVRPSAALIETNHHIQVVIALPHHHFLASETAAIHPAIVAACALVLVARTRPTALVALAWLIGTLGGLVLLATTGHSSQLRFATIATPPIHLAAALALAGLGARRPRLALGLGLALVAHALVLDAIVVAQPRMSILGAWWRYL